MTGMEWAFTVLPEVKEQWQSERETHLRRLVAWGMAYAIADYRDSPEFTSVEDTRKQAIQAMADMAEMLKRTAAEAKRVERQRMRAERIEQTKRLHLTVGVHK